MSELPCSRSVHPSLANSSDGIENAVRAPVVLGGLNAGNSDELGGGEKSDAFSATGVVFDMTTKTGGLLYSSDTSPFPSNEAQLAALTKRLINAYSGTDLSAASKSVQTLLSSPEPQKLVL